MPLSQERRQKIKLEYETTSKPVAAICKDHRIASRTLYEMAAREVWEMRGQPSGRGRRPMIRRLIKMLERHILYLEENMHDGEEKEIALLGTMTRNLEKLIALEKSPIPAAAERTDPREEREIEDIRRKLAARIDQLRKN